MKISNNYIAITNKSIRKPIQSMQNFIILENYDPKNYEFGLGTYFNQHVQHYSLLHNYQKICIQSSYHDSEDSIHATVESIELKNNKIQSIKISTSGVIRKNLEFIFNQLECLCKKEFNFPSNTSGVVNNGCIELSNLEQLYYHDGYNAKVIDGSTIRFGCKVLLFFRPSIVFKDDRFVTYCNIVVLAPNPFFKKVGSRFCDVELFFEDNISHEQCEE